MRIDFPTVTPAPWPFGSQTKTAYIILESGISAFNPGIKLASMTNRNGIMDD